MLFFRTFNIWCILDTSIVILCVQMWDGLVDLQKVVREMFPGQHRIGLKHLVWQFLGFWPPKGCEITLGDWEAQWLTRSQINYAMLDALYVGEIFRCMRCIQVRIPPLS